MEMLSDRRNIVFIADEAHRSQYGFGGKVNEMTGEMSYGFASNLRDALSNAPWKCRMTNSECRMVVVTSQFALLHLHFARP